MSQWQLRGLGGQSFLKPSAWLMHIYLCEEVSPFHNGYFQLEVRYRLLKCPSQWVFQIGGWRILKAFNTAVKWKASGTLSYCSLELKGRVLETLAIESLKHLRNYHTQETTKKMCLWYHVKWIEIGSTIIIEREIENWRDWRMWWRVPKY